MSATEIARVYGQARELGFVMNAIWGGEPLLRQDLPEIAASSRSSGLVTTVITNGYYLADRLGELSRCVDCFIVSLDETGDRHDAMRGKEGIYERAIRGIERAKGYPGIKVMINSVFSRLNVGAVERLVFMADELGVSIYLCPIETGSGRAGFDQGKEHLGLDRAQLEEFSRTVMALKRRGFRINNSFTYLKTFIGGKKPFRCHAQKIAVGIDANGDVKNCIAWEPFGNVRQTSLREILESESVRTARRQSESCSACNNPDVIDCSYVWQLRPESVWSFARLFLD